MLQGTLNDFSLPDVFSLLALTKKSGALQVASGGVDGRVFFREGAVCLALSDARRVPLVARLVSAGLVDEAQLRTLLEEHTGSSIAVTQAIITSGQVEDRILSVFLREQIVDAVFELLRLKEGEFSFDATQPGLSRGVSLSVVEVTGEANRRLEEWQLISRRIASPTAVLAMVPSAMDGREGVNLASEQWDLLALIDGRRTVAEVVELTGKGEFATCRVLGDLVEAGLVEAADPATGAQTRLASLIAARETLRALEQVEKSGGLQTKLSSATLGANGQGVRWIEPTKDESFGNGHGDPAKISRIAPRTKMGEVAEAAGEKPAALKQPVLNGAAGPSSPASEKPAEKPADAPQRVDAPKPAPAPARAETAPAPQPPPQDDKPAAQPAAKAPEPSDAPVGAGVASRGDMTPPNGIDRAQVARELASLGLDDEPFEAPAERTVTRLTRDEEVNKGLLLRLIDGVKGA